jgi:hypothetical protein
MSGGLEQDQGLDRVSLLHRLGSKKNLATFCRRENPLSGRERQLRLDALHVSPSEQNGIKKARLHFSTTADREDGEIEEYFGQLWWFPKTPLTPRVNHHTSTLFWIR